MNENLRRLVAFTLSLLSWFFGILFVLSGISLLFSPMWSSPIWSSGLLFIIMGAVLLPPVTKLVRNKFNFRLSAKVKTVVLLGCFILVTATTPKVEQPITEIEQPIVAEPSASPSPIEKVESVPKSSTFVAQNALIQVVSVGDGDTLRARLQGKIITIRLGCVDAPETTQTPWGKQSTNRLKQLLPASQVIQIREIDRDRYGRTVAELFLRNQSINLTMVKEGQAVVYPQYLSGCSETKEQYLQAEAQAKAQRLGFWNQNNPVMPWNFRAGKRKASPSSTNTNPRPIPTSTNTNPRPIPTSTNTNPRPIPTSTSTNPRPVPTEPSKQTPVPITADLPACTKTDCNCRDFQTRAEAKRVLDAFPDDPFDLDRNKDGVPCESLP